MKDENIMEIAEVPLNNFFIGVQFHPELNSSIFNPHPVLISFIKIINQLF
jgi:CTP synthase